MSMDSTWFHSSFSVHLYTYIFPSGSGLVSSVSSPALSSLSKMFTSPLLLPTQRISFSSSGTPCLGSSSFTLEALEEMDYPKRRLKRTELVHLSSLYGNGTEEMPADASCDTLRIEEDGIGVSTSYDKHTRSKRLLFLTELLVATFEYCLLYWHFDPPSVFTQEFKELCESIKINLQLDFRGKNSGDSLTGVLGGYTVNAEIGFGAKVELALHGFAARVLHDTHPVMIYKDSGDLQMKDLPCTMVCVVGPIAITSESNDALFSFTRTWVQWED
ncbi:hypothetical protein Tco_1429293 [Tanacetum coccineum]